MKISKLYLVLGLVVCSNLAFAKVDMRVTSNGAAGNFADDSLVITPTSISATTASATRSYAGNAITYSISRKLSRNDGISVAVHMKWIEISNNGAKDKHVIMISDDQVGGDPEHADDIASQIERCLLGINAGVYSKLSITANSKAYYLYDVGCSK
jgi:hypothetical protein